MAVPSFMAPLAGRQLRHIIMPGSHDAGLARAFQQDLSRFSSPETTITQNDSVGGQAAKGSRFFDVRIQSIGGTLTSFHTMPNLLGKIPLVKKLKATHTDTRTIGASGQGFANILDELRAFVANSSEFVIVRLSHLKDSAEVFQQLWDWIELPANRPHVYMGAGNLATHTVGNLAGHVVLVIESKKFKHLVAPPASVGGVPRIPTQADGFHKFYQSKGGNLPVVTDGLCVCGEFSNKNRLGDILKKQVTNYAAHDQHKNHQGNQAHLYSLYWTATGGNIEQNTTNELTSANFKQVRALVNATATKNWSDKLGANEQILMNPGVRRYNEEFRSENIARTKFAVKSASIPNIILYDFVNDTISQDIIDLNEVIAR